MSSSLSNFSPYKIIDSIIVNLPNGIHVYAIDHKGTVRMSEKLFLIDVLFILVFSYNIISIYKPMGNNNYKLAFYSKSCVIQDIRPTRGLVVEVKDELYTLDEYVAQSCCINSTIKLYYDVQNIYLLYGTFLSTKDLILRRNNFLTY